MNELIKIETNENGEVLVSGRELHEFLGIGTEYAKWFSRMVEYGFEENEDYVVIVKNDENLKGGRPSVNHAMKIDMAKEISMIQRSPKGKEARLYFIECEKQLKEQKPVLTYKQLLAIDIVGGGLKAIKASEELARIELLEQQEKYEEELLIQEERNELEKLRLKNGSEVNLTAEDVVRILRVHIPNLTTTTFHQWMANERGLGSYDFPLTKKNTLSKRRVFMPNEKFTEFVATLGFASTRKSGNEIRYREDFIDRMLEKGWVEELKDFIDKLESGNGEVF